LEALLLFNDKNKRFYFQKKTNEELNLGLKSIQKIFSTDIDVFHFHGKLYCQFLSGIQSADFKYFVLMCVYNFLSRLESNYNHTHAVGRECP
jgi:hypothetical protein